MVECRRQYLRTREEIPTSAVLVEAFRGAAESSAGHPPVVEVAAALAAHNERQWAAEDACRTDDDLAVANGKRLVDALNARRAELVERIDRWAAREIGSRPEASLHTETLGSVIDRLTIAWVRYRRLVDAAPADREVARLALRQLAELADAYDDLVRDFASGQRRLPVWRPLKSYGSGR